MTFPVRPVHGWCLVRELSPKEAAEVEDGAAVSDLLVFPEFAKREVGEHHPRRYRWVEMLRGPDGYDDVEAGAKLFVDSVSGSQGVNDNFTEFAGVKFFQVPIEAILLVVE